MRTKFRQSLRDIAKSDIFLNFSFCQISCKTISLRDVASSELKNSSFHFSSRHFPDKSVFGRNRADRDTKTHCRYQRAKIEFLYKYIYSPLPPLNKNILYPQDRFFISFFLRYSFFLTQMLNRLVSISTNTDYF